jgi:1-deoxy-D-xylulose-5-phosphate synthase
LNELLKKINSPADLRSLEIEQLDVLAEELRSYIIECVSKTGGHLASSLGAVELTLALHYVFNTPKDRIVWDVGHQAYAHKILTGRRDRFDTLRTRGGISGFPKISESEYDPFGAGHSSTSISAALGMAAASELSGSGAKAIAVIGDGSLTAGIAFEGLNQGGHIKKDFIVVLNDNEMSISKNVGALSSFLSRKLTGRMANRLKSEIETFITSIPMVGNKLMGLAKRAEDSLITLLTPGMLFEGLGFHYIGPIDGHNIKEVVDTLRDVSELKGPVLVHVLTKKGKGYLPAENDPSNFHGVSPFNPRTGKALKSSVKGAPPSYTSVFGSTMIEIAEADERVVAITAAMPAGTGLSQFALRFPDRYFDVGIAEQHGITFAAGLAREGFVPVTAIYSTFMGRAYDEIFHDVCLQNLPVIMALDRAGIVGQDGPTHHGLFDVSYLRHLPNIIFAAPKDEGELRQLLYSATRYGSPVAIRYPRGSGRGVDITEPFKEIEPGTAEVLRPGTDVTIIALGSMVAPAVEAAENLEAAGISAGVINARFVKPLDEELILKTITGTVVTVEENALQGGFGSAVLELFEEHNVECRVKRVGVPDRYIEHGTPDELKAELGLDAAGIEKAVKEFVNSIPSIAL